MADLMWGGVPFITPSETARKYLDCRTVTVKRQCDLPDGGRYNARMTMDREILGHRQTRLDMLESYDTYDRQERRARSEPWMEDSNKAGVNKNSQGIIYEPLMDPIHSHDRNCSYRSALTRCPLFRCNKPGAGLGWIEPRHEPSLGYSDKRRHIPGYIGGVRLRDSIAAGIRGV